MNMEISIIDFQCLRVALNLPTSDFAVSSGLVPSLRDTSDTSPLKGIPGFPNKKNQAQQLESDARQDEDVNSVVSFLEIINI